MGEALLKVLLVDDEPFILQGLKILIDWEQEGFEVVKTAANGEEALEYLRGEQVDLIIADIKMPVVTGLELLEKIRGEKISDAHFVILSGYADFEYARKAIRYDCTDYILKPVDREELLKVLNKVQVLRRADNQKKQSSREMEQAYLSRHLIALIQGKFDSVNLEYVKSHMDGASGIRYVEIQMDDDGRAEEISDKEKRGFQRQLYQYCIEFLGPHASHCVFDVSTHEKIYDIGLLYCDAFAKEQGIDGKTYLNRFLEYLIANMHQPVIMLVGKKVQDISNIARSYGNACMLRSFQGFRAKKPIIHQGKIANMADRLIAEGKMTEMILVMQKCSKRKEARIPEEIIQKYRVIPGEEHRAMIKAQDGSDWTSRRHQLAEQLKNSFR